jgi:hypothetical protein
VSEQGHDGEDDDQLRAMRVVWLSMRDADAEPPARGMAELLAAARAHAQEMQPEREPIWRRWFAALVRPPVLAFATVVVLAGTAAIVKSHDGLKSVDAPAETTAMQTTSTAAPVTMSAPAPPPAPPTGAFAEGGGAAGDHGAAAAPAAAAPAREAAAAHTVRLSAAPRAAEPEKPVVAPFEKTPSPRALKKAASAPAPAPDDADAPRVQLADVPATAPQRAYAKPPPPVSNDQLLRECQAAAARGDCAAVRSFAVRMRAQDAAFYRDTFARDADIAKCLPAPNAE